MKLCNWKELKEKLKNLSGKDVINEITQNIEFIIENYRTPREFYKWENPKMEEINQKVIYLRQISMIIFSKENEEIIKKIWESIDGKDKADYISFVVFFKNTMSGIIPYGEKIYSQNSLGEYAENLLNLIEAHRLLSCGEFTNITHIKGYEEIVREERQKTINEIKRKRDKIFS